MRLCFVIQPFDGGPFDARYDETLAPAIKAAGFEPYRVDRDPKVTIPIKSVEEMILSADVCLADISENNPNVWLELGLAFAAAKPVLLIAKDVRRKSYPFDVQHLHIVRYRTESEKDFRLLREQISTRLPEIGAGATASVQSRTVAPKLDSILREDVKRLEELRAAIASVNVQRDIVFTRLKLIFDIRANRAYENFDEPGLARTVHALARKEATQFATTHGLAAEWREWLRRRSASALRKRRKP